MAVIALYGFRTAPGKLADHLAGAAEGLGHLRRLGLQAVNLQVIAGTDVGVIATSVNHASNADYAAGTAEGAGRRAVAGVLGAGQFRRCGGRGRELVVRRHRRHVPAQRGSGRSGLSSRTQWRARPGRLMDLMGNVMTAIPHIERLGGQARVMQSLIGLHPLTLLVTTAFSDLDAYGVYADKTATDEQWQAYWMGVMADPTADLIRSGLYMNISDG